MGSFETQRPRVSSFDGADEVKSIDIFVLHQRKCASLNLVIGMRKNHFAWQKKRKSHLKIRYKKFKSGEQFLNFIMCSDKNTFILCQVLPWAAQRPSRSGCCIVHRKFASKFVTKTIWNYSVGDFGWKWVMLNTIHLSRTNMLLHGLLSINSYTLNGMTLARVKIMANDKKTWFLNFLGPSITPRLSKKLKPF